MDGAEIREGQAATEGLKVFEDTLGHLYIGEVAKSRGDQEKSFPSQELKDLLAKIPAELKLDRANAEAAIDLVKKGLAVLSLSLFCLFSSPLAAQVQMCQASGAVPIPCAADSSGNQGVYIAPSSSSGVTGVNASGTIAVTDTFQTALAASATRKGCLVQNQSATRNVYIFLNGTGVLSPTKAASLQLTPYTSYSCANGVGGVETSLIQITGTNPDTYVVVSE